MSWRRVMLSAVMCVIAFQASPQAQPLEQVEYRVLATNKTSTMEKELNEAAAAGFRFDAVMGGGTDGGGKEVVIVMKRSAGDVGGSQYKLLATNRTSTMQKELREAATDGFDYRSQTVFETAFGGREVVCILERDAAQTGPSAFEYLLVATSRTSTFQKELQEASDDGHELLGMTVGKTMLGGQEMVAIMRRPNR